MMTQADDAVAELAGIAGGDVRAGAEHRLKRREAFERGVGRGCPRPWRA